VNAAPFRFRASRKVNWKQVAVVETEEAPTEAAPLLATLRRAMRWLPPILRRPYLLVFGSLAASRILFWMAIISSHSSAVDISFRVSWRRLAEDFFLSGLGFGRSRMHDLQRATSRKFPTEI
jgi:hypothetical protein